MATASWSTVVDQTTDAAFQTWVAEFIAKMVAVGMVQTADSGQINTATVTRAGANTSAGYAIFHTPDSNLFLKMEFGSGAVNTQPSFWTTVGTGSDGAGNITGQASTRTQQGNTGAIASTVTNYQSYMCASGSYFGVAWKIASSGTAGRPRYAFVMQPTVDNTGARTATGFLVWFGTAAAAVDWQAVKTSATASSGPVGTSGFPCLLPCFTGTTTASTDGTNNQVYLHWWALPGTSGGGAVPMLYSGTIISAELSNGSTISDTLVGSTPHTYIAISNSSSNNWDASGITAPVIGAVMLYE